MKNKRIIKRIITALLMLSLFVGALSPFASAADKKDHKTVRVGWFDSSFNYYDEFGRRCGIGYEYQQKISAYTGWTYEYVEGSWATLFQMLKDGEIDLLSDVSYKEEREEYMLYPDLPMGTESYYIYVGMEDREITSDNVKSVNGKKIGVNKGSIQEGFLKEWAEKYDVSVEIVPLTGSEGDSMGMVESGKIDGYASIYTYDSEQRVVPVFRIGGSDYYYAVNKNRQDLLTELNMALSEIQDEDPYFNMKISEDRLYNTRTSALISPIQKDWLKEHGAIKVGYRDDYLPFCDKDDKTGELTGALGDYLNHANNTFEGTDVKFETIAYASTEAALDALKAGEVDCVFPVYLNTYDAEQMEIRLTSPAMKTGMNAIMRSSDTRVPSKESKLVFAIIRGMMNIDTFIKEEYPASERKEYDSLDACSKAVSDGEADCVLVSNYLISSVEGTIKKYKLTSVPTGEHAEFSFAVDLWNKELYLLLNKTILTTKSEDMDSSLASYTVVERKVTFIDFLRDNMVPVLCAILAVFAIVVFLLMQKMKIERTANRQKRLLEEAVEVSKLKQTITSLLNNMPGMNFTKDAETGVYLACNQAFAEYAGKKNPSEVIGLKPEDCFDTEKTAEVEGDDKVVLSMDEPYVFFDDIKEKDGSTRQVKTTKLKYVDEEGRKCVLGMIQDVTDSFRITRKYAGSREAYEKAKSNGIIFTHIAQTLARGYVDLYYVDINTEEYVEYHTDPQTGYLEEVRRGWHFFESCVDEAEIYIYPEDREMFVGALDRKTLVSELDKNDPFTMTYRKIGEDGPFYVSLKASRMQDDNSYLIIGVTNVDEQIKEHTAAQKIREERNAYSRISALAGDFICIYIVDPDTGAYREFSSTTGFNYFDLPAEGRDFFGDFRQLAVPVVYPDDQNRFLSMFTGSNVFAEVEQSGIFTLSYRLSTDGEPRYVQLKAAMVDEKEGRRLIIGVNDIDAQVRQEEEYGRRLAQARIEANIDALTGVKNRNAYKVYEDRLNAQIELNRTPGFAISILDVNDLKKVNDTEGHKAGDQYLRDACRIICTTFKRSPVFRVGGDEFAVLSQGDDYERIDELIDQMNHHNEEAILSGGIVIAVGMSRYDHDPKVAQVYERADMFMYENKSDLKSRKKQ